MKQLARALFVSYLLPLRSSTATVVTPVELFCRFIESRSANLAAALSEVVGRPVESVEVKHVVLPAELVEGSSRPHKTATGLV